MMSAFPSPAADYIEKPIDLNELLIRHPAATYFFRAVSGDSMSGIGIYEGSLLLIDASDLPQHGDIIIVNLGGEFAVKRLLTYPTRQLCAENPAYPPIKLHEGEDLETFGIVKFIINEAKNLSQKELSDRN